MAPETPIPITIVTGFLGSGKTTLILNLIPQLPKDYRLALLKNEFGDVAIDSQLASSAAISGVQELLNGCICCNLVGQLSDALEALRRDHVPDRILIETSGSAFPATLAMEVNRLGRESGHYVLDGVVTVIDVENWQGYEDTSVTAKLQAKFTDLIVLNKWESVSEMAYEKCVDRILDLELDVPTPREKSSQGWVSKDVLLGLDAKLAQETDAMKKQTHSHDHEHHSEVEVLSLTLTGDSPQPSVDTKKLQGLLERAPKDEIYRMKGIVYTKTAPMSSDGTPAAGPVGNGDSRNALCYILNWAFGRWTFTLAPALGSKCTNSEPTLRMTIIAARYESSKWKRRIEAGEFVALEESTSSVVSVERVS